MKKILGILIMTLLIGATFLAITTSGKSIEKIDNKKEIDEPIKRIIGTELFSQVFSSMGTKTTGIFKLGYYKTGDTLRACISADGGVTWVSYEDNPKEISFLEKNILPSLTFSDQIDQQQLEQNCSILIFVDWIEAVAQSFKPTLNTLTRVELFVSGHFECSIRSSLTGQDLTSVTESYPDDEQNWHFFDFDDISVNPESTYYIVLEPIGDTTNSWCAFDGFGNTDIYQRGSEYIKEEGEPWIEGGDGYIDCTFKTYGTTISEDEIWVDDDATNSWYDETHVDSIQTGLNRLQENGVVHVYPGTYNENIIWPDTEGINLISEDGKDSTFIDGGETDSVISISSDLTEEVMISGFTIQNGEAENGGGVYFAKCCHPHKLHIRNCTITDCNADNNGGGLYFEGAELDTKDCVIQDCHAGNNGGGFCFSPGPGNYNTGRSNHDGIIIRDNDADGDGGGEYIGGEDTGLSLDLLEINNENCEYNNNHAGGNGGGRCMGVGNYNTGRSNNTSTIFDGNTADEDGGGEYIGGGDGTADLELLESNNTDGVYLNNSAGNNGGGFCFSPDVGNHNTARSNHDSCSFSGNTAPNEGYDIWAGTCGGPSVISDCDFGDGSTLTGGFQPPQQASNIWIESGEIKIKRCEASGSKGGFAVGGFSPALTGPSNSNNVNVEILDCDFNMNDGYGLLIGENLFGTIQGCTIKNNNEDGLIIEGNTGAIDMKYNNIYDNSGYELITERTDPIVDAQYCWWGDDNDPGDEIQGDVNYDNWLTEPPTLECEGTLNWGEINPGDTVTESFTVKNIGDSKSRLDWEIYQYPDWGTWSFEPQSGGDLTPEDGSTTVQITVIAPDEEKTDFTGEIKVINSDDSTNYDTIQVTLSTPKTKEKTFNNPIFRFLENHPLINKIIQILIQI